MSYRCLTSLAVATLLFAVATNAADFGSAMMQYQQRNYVAAYKEFNLLANQGDADAQFVLGDMYSKGQGTKQDYVQAHKWYSLAAQNGAQGAAQARDDLAKRMTKKEITDAERLAREWRASGSTLAETAPGPAASEAPPASTAVPAQEAPVSSGGGFFSKLARGATGLLGGPTAGYSDARAPTATIGIRGLSAEELRSARPNMSALQQMESYQVSEGDAAGFARSAKLTAQSVPYLAGTATPGQSTSPNPLIGR